MSSYVNKLTADKLANPPSWLVYNTHYECLSGSLAYGTATDSSDRDVCGFCIPPKDTVFPHLAGEILGFGRQKKRFDQWQQHHIVDASALGGRGCTYDITIYSIVRYVNLCMENNPNMLDSLFVPDECVLHCTAVGQILRDNRRRFLHKGCWPKFKGYAYSQRHKMDSKERSGKRKESYDTFGFDVKFACHTVRLLYEAEMILSEGDIDLRRHSEHLKTIRRGEVPVGEIHQWSVKKEMDLEKLYAESKLPWGPDEAFIKRLLLDCLESHYGDLSACVVVVPAAVKAVQDIQRILDDYNAGR